MIRIRLLLVFSSIIAITVCQLVILAQVQSSPTTSTVEIHGQVRFVEGGAPAANVVVRLESYDGGGSISEAFTDRLGKFRFTGLPPAQYSVRIRQSGYRDAQQNIDMTITTSGLVMLQLMRDGSVSTTSSISGSIDANVPAAAQKEFDKGVAALAEGSKEKTEFAVRCFEKAVSIYPKFVEARLKLGTAEMDLAQWEKAEKALLETIQVDGKAFNAFFALGEVYLRQNRIADAEKVLTRGLAIQDASYLGHLNLARVYWEKAREIKDLTQAKPALEKAYDEVKRALTLNPDLATAHLLKGNLLLRVQRTADALVEFGEYLRLEPNGPFAAETRTLVGKIKKAQARG
ncbi:MAG TPA: carboxypeptidase regulatory-like domain-containing protein [Pyrinomonadaceae bacterium]|nr:carboxypeptidase regulatory-like domain-containing protein [Pyrinomonadaceae bacterium]